MYKKDLPKDWFGPHPIECGWYLDCSIIHLQRFLFVKILSLGLQSRLQGPMCLKVPKNQGLPLRRKVKKSLRPKKLWLIQRGPRMIFKRPWISFRRHHLPRLLVWFHCPLLLRLKRNIHSLVLFSFLLARGHGKIFYSTQMIFKCKRKLHLFFMFTNLP